MRKAPSSERRPGRPKSPEKRAAILEAAGHSFLDRGFVGTSIDAVADAAGVAKPTVYSHFGSKEELFQAVIAGKCASYEFSDDMPRNDAPLDVGLRALTRRYLDLIFDPAVVAMMRQVIAQSVAHREMAELFHEAGPARTIRTLAAILSAHVATGELAIDDPQATAANYLHAAGARYKTEMLMNLRDEVSEEERRAEADRMVEAFVALHRRA